VAASEERAGAGPSGARPRRPTAPPIRAVVFDLDDTLFDAFGQCVGPAQREAAAAMRAAGLRAPLEAVVALREAFAGRALDVDAAVADAFPCADPTRVAAAGRRAYFERDPGAITPFPFAADVLAEVRARARCVLLTAGSAPTQRAKVERLGLARSFDETLFVDPDRDQVSVATCKQTALAALIAAQGLVPDEVLVVGDRPAGEIAAALALGCRALRIKGGECAREATPAGATEVQDVRGVLLHL
jgi:FMN phosphatase YigB (HAD superfamily)